MAKFQTGKDHLPGRNPGDEDDGLKPEKPSALFDTDEEYQDFRKQLDAMLGVPDYDDEDDEDDQDW